MLTDNGRQYVSWRGTSRFAAELQKDRVVHMPAFLQQAAAGNASAAPIFS